jgi:hypothetical protein
MTVPDGQFGIENFEERPIPHRIGLEFSLLLSLLQGKESK